MIRIAAFLRQDRGATAAEFALVLPVALLFLLGIIDVGRYAWAMNRMEKAVQMGTRYAVATSIVPEGLNSKDFVGFDCGGTSVLGPGDPICRDAIGTIACTGSPASCTCTPSALSGSCTGLPGNADNDAFTKIVNRMRVVSRSVQPGDVTITYSGSGLGYAGDPSVADDGTPLSQVSPVVSVQVKGATFRSLVAFGAPLRLPTFRYSETLEDGDGSVAY
ncbi:pilus assembly protein [Novosphingobium sp. ZN18A2]|uniref:TadE/TadG family type IV pilus assembly protein n=1 Tax=Novosphingobium sp. ZN18A2 TaxID=3079861 RepID=UPI0030D43EE3